MSETVFIILFITLFTACIQVENKKWKYGSGFYIGDLIDDNSNKFSIKSDTIYFEEKPVARVYLYKDRLLDQTLVIEKLNDTIKGYYHSK